MSGKIYNLDGLHELQRDAADWRAEMFAAVPGFQGELMLLGVIEEVGELARAILKRKQGIRESSDQTREEFLYSVMDAIGDIVIYLFAVADAYGLEIGDAIKHAWKEAGGRDWVTFPKDGVSE